MYCQSIKAGGILPSRMMPSMLFDDMKKLDENRAQAKTLPMKRVTNILTIPREFIKQGMQSSPH